MISQQGDIMAKKSYTIPYDYSNKTPMHSFIHNGLEASIKIYHDSYNYVMVQKDPKGQQRLIINEITLTKMLRNLDQHGWEEIKCR